MCSSKNSKRTSSGSSGSSKCGSGTITNGCTSGSINLKDLATTSANVASGTNSKASSSKITIINKKIQMARFIINNGY